jgi:phytoene dehydrogenase-like protein
VHLDSAVAEDHDVGRGVSGVRLADGRPVPADVVVSDADARVLYDRLLPAARGRGRPGPCCAARRSSVAGFVLLLALDGRGRRAGAGAPRLVPARLRRRVRRAVPPPAPVADPTVYVHAPADPAMAPPAARRGSCWSTPRCTTRRAGSTGTARPARALRGPRAGGAGRRGEDVRGRVRWREIRTPADLERGTAAPGGAIYGTASHGMLAALLRPANRSPVPGLYLVGGSAHPGGGLPIVALSAKIVADLVGPA